MYALQRDVEAGNQRKDKAGHLCPFRRVITADGRGVDLESPSSPAALFLIAIGYISTTYPIRAEVLQILCGNIGNALLGKDSG